jgi:hypothetical protein
MVRRDLTMGRVSDWNIRRPLDTIKAQPATSSQFGQLETFEGYAEISGKQAPAGGREPPDGTGSMVGLPLVDEVSKNGPADVH